MIFTLVENLQSREFLWIEALYLTVSGCLAYKSWSYLINSCIRAPVECGSPLQFRRHVRLQIQYEIKTTVKKFVEILRRPIYKLVNTTWRDSSYSPAVHYKYTFRYTFRIIYGVE